MSRLSISKAWDEAKAGLVRESRLLSAVALALFVLPGVVLSLILPTMAPDQLPPAGPWMIGLAVILIISMIGQIAVIRLSMGPHVSVGEAIGHGARRMPIYLAAVLLWVVPLVLVCIAAVVLIGSEAAGAKVAGLVAVVATTTAIMLAAVRLMLISAVASAEDLGPVAILRRSWAITRGSWSRLFAFLVLFTIGAGVLLWVIGVVAGSIAKIAFGGIDAMTLGGLFAATVSQLASAVVSVVFFAMLARIYLQLSGRGEAETGVPRSGT